MMSSAAPTDTSTDDLLLAAAEAGDRGEVARLLTGGGHAYYQRDSDGMSVLMAAASSGEAGVVTLLLEKGAPWNAVDRAGKCAGEYALGNSHQHVVDDLVNAGVRAEMILGAMARNQKQKHACSAKYLERSVRYEKDRLIDEEDDAVMMEWETPIMQTHAAVLVPVEGEGDVLNIGFGMGIVDKAIQLRRPASHTIIEAHPEVYKKMLADGWDTKPGVTILFGRWQDVLPHLLVQGSTGEGTGEGTEVSVSAAADVSASSSSSSSSSSSVPCATYDGIFYDTYGEYDADMRELHQLFPRILRKGGLYSFFNGLCPGNIFFHGVACQVVQLELAGMGLEAEFIPCEFSGPQLDSEQWDGVKRSYYWSDTYYLPLCRMLGGDGAGDGVGDGDGSSGGEAKEAKESAVASETAEGGALGEAVGDTKRQKVAGEN